MTNRAVISTADAPAAIGPYSQAIKVGNIVWVSGQIPLVPETMEIVAGDISAQAHRSSATSPPWRRPPVAVSTTRLNSTSP